MQEVPPSESMDVMLPVPGGTRAGAEEWALVLVSQGIGTRIVPAAFGYALAVGEHEAAAARQVLDRYLDENRRAAVQAASEDAPVRLAEVGFVGAYVALILLASHWIATREAFHAQIYERGSADASAILGGEWWRTVTALFLHSDLGHVVGNVLFGVYFLTAATRTLGVGLGLALVLAAGAIGNGLNAVANGHGHESIGASTAVFGAIGILAGMALARRNRSGLRGARLLLPVGAGLGLLGMLGTGGPRVDVFAHLYGLLAGGVLGIAVWLGVHGRPRPTIQFGLGLASIATVLLCFAQVLRD